MGNVGDWYSCFNGTEALKESYESFLPLVVEGHGSVEWSVILMCKIVCIGGYLLDLKGDGSHCANFVVV